MAHVLSWLKNYGADTQSHDELVDGKGGIRPHWRPVIEKLTSDNPHLAQRALHMTRRMVVENGVTYNVYADAQGRDRPWVLDPMPVVLPADQWREIESGVRQRARLAKMAYRRRFGIETSYRQQNEGKGRTTAKDVCYRLLLVGLALLLRQAWVWLTGQIARQRGARPGAWVGALPLGALLGWLEAALRRRYKEARAIPLPAPLLPLADAS